MPSTLTEIARFSSADKEEILLEVEQLLASRYFRASRRYPAFLRFVVQHTLEGHPDVLKERTLGIEVFGREPSFDASADSIVRVTAAEIRKRIAQYYQDEAQAHSLRIDLPFGSYIPRFLRLEMATPLTDGQLATHEPVLSHQSQQGAEPKAKLLGRKQVAVATAMLFLIVVATLVASRYLSPPRTQRDLLAPIWKSPNETLLCIGSPEIAYIGRVASDVETPMAFHPYPMNNALLPFADSLTLSHFQILLNNRRKPNQIKLARNTTLSDLRSGPVVLIAAFDNPWTLRLTSKFRYHFVGTEAGAGKFDTASRSTEAMIADSKESPNTKGSVDPNGPPYRLSASQDFAIVAITQDETLGQPLIVAAGIGPSGTMAAGEFLLNNDNLDTLVRMAPAHWSGRNVEAVISTQVIQGNSGPPRIVATEYW